MSVPLWENWLYKRPKTIKPGSTQTLLLLKMHCSWLYSLKRVLLLCFILFYIEKWGNKSIICHIPMCLWGQIYLVLQFQFHGGQIQPAWCSSHRSHCCRECWPGLCPGGTSHRQSCRCTTQLRNREHKRSLLWKSKQKNQLWNIHFKSIVCSVELVLYAAYSILYLYVFVANMSVQYLYV